MKSNGDYTFINLLVKPVALSSDGERRAIVVFEEIPHLPPPSRAVGQLKGLQSKRIQELEKELNHTKDYLQTTIEELQASNEELKSTNEELQASNEELQSTIEESDTSKEELQSVNEELTTLNAELQNKIRELSDANDDISNLLASTEIGTIFLDKDLLIKRFTPASTKILNFINADVGRPVSHIASNFKGSVDFIRSAGEVMRTLIPKVQEVQTNEGDWYTMRILPYRTRDNVILGLVVTFAPLKKPRLLQEYGSKVLKTLEEAGKVLVITDPEGVISYVSDGISRAGYKSQDLVGQHSRILKSGAMEEKFYRNLWETINRGEIWSGEFINRKKDGTQYKVQSVIYPVKDDKGTITYFLGVQDF